MELLSVAKEQYKETLPIIKNKEETIVEELQNKFLQALKL